MKKNVVTQITVNSKGLLNVARINVLLDNLGIKDVSSKLTLFALITEKKIFRDLFCFCLLINFFFDQRNLMVSGLFNKQAKICSITCFISDLAEAWLRVFANNAGQTQAQ